VKGYQSFDFAFMRAEDRVSAAIRESGTDCAGAFITCKLSRKPNVKAARESVHAATSIQPHYFRNLILPSTDIFAI